MPAGKRARGAHSTPARAHPNAFGRKNFPPSRPAAPGAELSREWPQLATRPEPSRSSRSGLHGLLVRHGSCLPLSVSQVESASAGRHDSSPRRA